MEILLILLFALYGIFVMLVIFGWRKAVNPKETTHSSSQPFVSVVVPVRNEEQNIEKLLNCLLEQTYPAFEVIVVNDHSEDRTTELIANQKDSRLKLLDLDATSGKKAALSAGIKLATGEIIITTDGDCKMGTNWLSCIVKYFSPDTKLAFGLVRISAQGSTFASLQSTEFASVIGVGVATNQLGMPTMCNGANLAFRKSVFEEVSGYEGNEHIPSGDDVFLLKKISREYPAGIQFIPAVEAIVDTAPQETFRDFTFQRIRWAGKWKVKTSMLTKCMALFVFTINLIAISFPFLIVFRYIAVEVVISLIIFRSTVDRIFLKRMSNYMTLAWKLPHIILLQLIYPVYVVVIAIAAGSRPFIWKGRKIYSGINQNAA